MESYKKFKIYQKSSDIGFDKKRYEMGFRPTNLIYVNNTCCKLSGN